MNNKFDIILRDGTSTTLDMSIFNIDKNNGMVNITKIAKACGKRANDWLSLSQTKELISAWDITTRIDGSADSKVLMTVNGGLNTGTWVIRELALNFAQWISPSFNVFNKVCFKC